MAVALFWIWISWPYLSSTVVRDAAVTSWLNTAASPIAGDLDHSALPPGSIVGADGRIAGVVNPRADRTGLERAKAELATTEARLERLRQSKLLRENLIAHYTAAFREELDLRIPEQVAVLEFLRERLTAERAEAARASNLRAAGSASFSAAEAAAARVAALESERVALEGALARNRLRRQAADRGVYLLEDLTPAEWSGRFDLLRIDDELAVAESALASARQVLAAAQEHYDRHYMATLSAPAGALVWGRIATPGAPVAAGAPVSTWIDPTQLLVDVPISDVEAGLLAPGARAQVIIEGERRAREGVVVFTRGSAGVLGGRDLAALAKGRRPGDGQAIVRLESLPSDRTHSPIGRAAYVDFPSVGAFSILRARLRL